jgi:hypothetical protein
MRTGRLQGQRLALPRQMYCEELHRRQGIQPDEIRCFGGTGCSKERWSHDDFSDTKRPRARLESQLAIPPSLSSFQQPPDHLLGTYRTRAYLCRNKDLARPFFSDAQERTLTHSTTRSCFTSTHSGLGSVRFNPTRDKSLLRRPGSESLHAAV